MIRMDRPIEYTTKELGILLSELNAHVIEIKEQVKYTNGQVKSLQLWKQFLLGGWSVLTIITPILWYYIHISIEEFKKNFDERVTAIVKEEITQNNAKYFEK